MNKIKQLIHHTVKMEAVISILDNYSMSVHALDMSSELLDSG